MAEVKGMNQHQFPPGLELLYVDISEEQDPEKVEKEKLKYL